MSSTTARRAIVAALIAFNLAVAAYLLLMPGQRRSTSPDRPPNVLLVTVDCLRADQIAPSPDGLSSQRTSPMPFTRALAAAGLSCRVAYAHCGITETAARCLLTSRTIRRDLDTPDAGPALQQVLADKGYQTGAFLSWCSFLRPEHAQRFTRGFAAFDCPPDQGRDGDDTTARAERWIDAVSGKAPWFAWVMFWDAHPRPSTPMTFAYYTEALAKDDRCIERLLRRIDQLGETDNTVVIITGIHGIELRPDETPEELAEQRLRVPLIFVYPRGVMAGQQVDELVGHLDVMPTLLALIGVTAPPSAMGANLLAPLPKGRPVYVETPDIARAVREGPWKLVEYDAPVRHWRDGRVVAVLHEGGTRALYNVENDPRQTADLSARKPDQVRRMQALMREWHAPRVPAASTPAPALRKALQDHGYW